MKGKALHRFEQDDFVELLDGLVDDIPKFKTWCINHVNIVDDFNYVLKDITYTNIIFTLEQLIEYFNENIL